MNMRAQVYTYDVSYMEALTMGFKRYTEFSGRSSRSEFWRFMVTREIILAIASFVGYVLYMLLGDESAGVDIYNIFTILLYVAYIVPTLSFTSRRLHDINKSGWTILIGLIPVIGFFVMLYYLVTPGDTEDNLYGSPTGYVRITKEVASSIGRECTPSTREDYCMGILVIIMFLIDFVVNYIDNYWAIYSLLMNRIF